MILIASDGDVSELMIEFFFYQSERIVPGLHVKRTNDPRWPIKGDWHNMTRMLITGGAPASSGETVSVAHELSGEISAAILAREEETRKLKGTERGQLPFRSCNVKFRWIVKRILRSLFLNIHGSLQHSWLARCASNSSSKSSGRALVIKYGRSRSDVISKLNSAS